MDMLLLSLTITTVLVVSSMGQQSCNRRVCYFSSKAQKRGTKQTKFLPENIDLTLCTHIIYKSAQLTAKGIAAGDPMDETSNVYIGNYEKITDLKHDDTNLKVLLALYVAPRDSREFAIVTSSERFLRMFVGNVIQFLRDRNFDGLDFQFFIYGRQKTSPGIKNKISTVLEYLRLAFDGEKSDSDRLLLTAAVYGEKLVEDESFDVRAISRAVEWINFLAIDFNGPWYGLTGHHTPLFPDLVNKGSLYNVDKAVKHWIDRGTPRDKIVLTLPFRGRTFYLTSSNRGVGAPATGGTYANYTKEKDQIAYFEICELKSLGLYTFVYMSEQGATYLVSGNVWISYDDVESMRQKVRYIKDRGLGGFAADSIDEDDVLGYFCGSGPYPLLRAANRECTL